MWAGLLIVAVISIAFGIFVMYFRNLRDGVSTIDGYIFIFGTFIVLAYADDIELKFYRKRQKRCTVM